MCASESLSIARAMLAMHPLGVLVGPVVRADRVVAAVQRHIFHRRETRFMRPAFEDSCRVASKSSRKPLQFVTADTRKKHEIRAARHDVNGVDLQQAHAPDRGQHAPARSANARGGDSTDPERPVADSAPGCADMAYSARTSRDRRHGSEHAVSFRLAAKNGFSRHAPVRYKTGASFPGPLMEDV